MNKSEVCVKLTRKNCKKVLGILEMFGEPIHRLTFDRISKSDRLGFYIEFWKHRWIDSSNDESKLCIKPRELRNILAKEHLKAGDVVVVNNPSSETGWIVKFGDFSEDGKRMFCSQIHCLSGEKVMSPKIIDFNFLRYTTDKEKALLEPKQGIETADPVNSFTGSIPGKVTYTQEVWVNHYNDREFYVHMTEGSAKQFSQGPGKITVKATLTYDIPMTKV